MLETGFCNDMLGSYLTYRIMVVNADFDRVTCSCPMDRRITVACLGNCTYVNNLDGIGIGLSLNSVYDILHSGRVGLDRLLRIIVRSGRNHSADMKNVVRTCYGLKNVVVICQIAPDKLNAGVICINLKKLFVFIAAPVEQNNVVFVSFGIKLFKACQAHCSR